MRILFSLLMIGVLSGCADTNRYKKSLSPDFTTISENKGLLAFTAGQKAFSDGRKLFLSGSVLSMTNNETDELAEVFSKPSDFEETNKDDYKRLDYLIELDAGTYTLRPLRPATATYVVHPQPHEFKIVSGAVTYIGQHDVGLHSTGSSPFAGGIKKTVSIVGDHRAENMTHILNKYPQISEYKVRYQVPEERTYRTKKLTAPMVVYF